MMLKFSPGTKRKQALLMRLGELTGFQPIAFAAPAGVFQCGDYLIDAQGNLTVEAEQADAQVLSRLLSEGMIGQGEVMLMQEHLNKRMVSFQALQDDITVYVGFPVPLAYFHGTGLRNLLYLIDSKEALLNQATDGCFHVPAGLMRAMQDDSCTYGTANFRRMLKAYACKHSERLKGIIITETHVIFTGFGKQATKEQMEAYAYLFLRMSAQAIWQKRIVRKKVAMQNEKYALRNWMVQMGMCGKEYRVARKVLLRKMDGVTTYATEEKARAARKKVHPCKTHKEGRKK